MRWNGLKANALRKLSSVERGDRGCEKKSRKQRHRCGSAERVVVDVLRQEGEAGISTENLHEKVYGHPAVSARDYKRLNALICRAREQGHDIKAAVSRCGHRGVKAIYFFHNHDSPAGAGIVHDNSREPKI